MNYISPSNHTESYLTGSTVKSMIDRSKELGLKYFSSTDLGMMTSSLKAYSYAKKNDVQFIAGIELFFKDKDCPIIKDTPSENIKYFKIIAHAQNQEAYQYLVKMSSDDSADIVTVAGNKYPIYKWADLEKLSKYNVSVCTSNIEGMVSKHLLVDRLDLSMKYYEKLRNMFGPENFYPTIVPYKQDKYWKAMANIKLSSGESIQIPLSDGVEYEEYSKKRNSFRWSKAYSRDGITALDLAKGSYKKKLTHILINKVRFPVSEKHQEVVSVDIVNNWQDLPYDIQTKANSMIVAFAKRYGDTDRLLINSYSFYAKYDDKVVQDMKLGAENRVYQHQYMTSTEDIDDYLKDSMDMSAPVINKLVENSYKWARRFDNFELKYDYRLPEVKGNHKELLIKQINKVGRMNWDNTVMVKQFREEFELLTDNGVIDLIPYFLPIVDVYDFYAENGHLTGPARGSAGGFLISYLLGVTHVDPIKYELSSSRFLTIDRVESGNLPDIDCDLESRVPLVGSDGNSGYLFNRYGKKAAQVSTRTLLRVKSAILDANRFVNGGTVEESVAALSKSLPATPQGTSDYEFVFGQEKDGNHIPGLLDQNKRLKKYSEERPKEWDIVVRALSLARQHSRHACFAKETLVKTIIDGVEVLKPIVECDSLLVYTGQGNVGFAKLLHQGQRDVKQYTMEDGSVIKCTPDHQILTKQGWFEIQDAEDKNMDIVDFNIKKIKVKRNIENIEKIVNNKGYRLTTMVNRNTISIKCPNDHEYTTSFGNFYNQNKNCSKCPRKYDKRSIISMLKDKRPDISYNHNDIDGVNGWTIRMEFKDPTYGSFMASPKGLIKHNVNHPNISNKNKGTTSLATKIKKYGKNWVNSEKSRKTLVARYGVTSSFDVNNNRSKTMIDRYGTTNPLQNKNIRNKFINTLKENGTTTMLSSGISLREYYNQVSGNISYNKLFVEYKKGVSLNKIIKDNIDKVTDIEATISRIFNINKFNKNIQINVKSDIKYKPDFKINDKLYLNVDGLYWHSEQIKDDNFYHFILRKYFEENELKILQFRSDEIDYKIHIVKSIINNSSGNTPRRIFARKTNIKTVSSKQAGEFLNKNHMMGKTNAKHIGLFHKEELVCLFSYKEYKDYVKCERFCSVVDSVVVGGFSKLFKKVLSDKPVHYWVDLRYGTGSHLLKKGFTLSHETLGWKWTDFKNTYNRRICRANMDDRKLKEREHANELGLFKIYDAGQRLYIYENKK